MTTPNPLIPQGSLEAQQYQKRSATKIVVSAILAVHGVVLGGLLFLGCEKPDEQVASAQPENSPFNAVDQPSAEVDPFASRLGTNEIDIPVISINTNDPFEGIQSRGGELIDPGTTTLLPPFPGDATNSLPRKNDEPTNPIVTPPIPTTPSDKYVVVSGDSFYTIAKKHNVTMPELVAVNQNVNPRKLQIGQTLNLPANVSPKSPPVPDDGPDTVAKNEVIHVVTSGDTLFGLERKYKVKVKDIQNANGIKGSNIRVGQKLVIPQASGTN